MTIDFVIAGASLPGTAALQDVAVGGGKILAIDPDILSDAPRIEAQAGLVTAGLVECHIHLDKAEILDRVEIVEGTLAEAVRETARAKAAFTVEDVYARAARVTEAAILNGTMAMRTFVEIDPRAGLRSLEAIKAIRADYAHAIDIQICAFAQEGLTNEPYTEPMLVEALENGADLIGGCSYQDPDPVAHIGRIFDLAQRFGVDADFHVDFNLDPAKADLPTIIAETERRGYNGRVACGHVTKLAAWSNEAVDAIAAQLKATGIGIIALPATDLFLLGRDATGLVPRGLAPLMRLRAAGAPVAIASNNVLNPFTPYGDANLVRMANLFANVAQLSRDDDLATALDMVGVNAAGMMGREHGVKVGGPADLLLFQPSSKADVVRRLAAPIMGWKAGRKSFERPLPQLLRQHR